MDSHSSKRNLEISPDMLKPKILILRYLINHDVQQFNYQSHHSYNLHAKKSKRKFCWHYLDSEAIQISLPPGTCNYFISFKNEKEVIDYY